MIGLSKRDLQDIKIGVEQDSALLEGASFFITGGTGYVGRWLLESICYLNDQLGLNMTATVLSRNPERFILDYPHLGGRECISLLGGDVRDFQYPQGEFTHVIHAATDVVAKNSCLETFEVTVNGSRRVLDFCKYGRVKKVLLMSSGAVYGKIPYDIDLVPETYPVAPGCKNPKDAYGIGKYVTEWLGSVYSESGKMACVSARIFAQIGPYLALNKQFAAGNFIFNAMREEPFLIKGDGTTRRSYMYGTDLVIWLFAILNHGEANHSYNVGSDKAISILDLAKRIALVAEIKEPIINILGTASPDVPPERYVPDINLAKEKLGMRINIELDDAIARTLEWFRPVFKNLYP